MDKAKPMSKQLVAWELKTKKMCNYCYELKHLFDFGKLKAGAFGVSGQCKDCTKYRRLAATPNHPEYIKLHAKIGPMRNDSPKSIKKYPRNGRAAYLKEKYGMTIEQYIKMLEEQENICLACGEILEPVVQGKMPVIDHCHKTGKVRGILHDRCNLGLGHAYDNPEILRKWASYLDRYL